MLFIAYSTLFFVLTSGTSCVSTTNVEFGQRRPTLLGQDLGKIMVRLFSPCNIVIVCICNGLICTLVAVHDCGTHTLTELVMCES